MAKLFIAITGGGLGMYMAAKESSARHTLSFYMEVCRAYYYGLPGHACSRDTHESAVPEHERGGKGDQKRVASVGVQGACPYRPGRQSAPHMPLQATATRHRTVRNLAYMLQET
jgi:hypothetical protein